MQTEPGGEMKRRIAMPPGASYHEELATCWSASYARGGFNRRLALVHRLLKGLVVPGSQWLDAGCGSGVLTGVLAQLGSRGVAVDGSAAMIDAALAQAPRELLRAFEFRRIDDLASLDVPSSAFDGVLCSSVIEYVDDPDRVLGELSRALREGGVGLISLAVRTSPVRMMQHVVRRAARFLGRDVYSYLGVSRWTYTGTGIAAAMHRAGFAVRAVHDFDPLLPTWLTKVVSPALRFVVVDKRV